MTEDEIDLASELDELATMKANSLGVQFAKFSDLVIDTARLLVCEFAFEQYLSFSTKFHAGSSNALRKLLDAFWLSLTLESTFQDSDYVKKRLDEAEIQEQNWDDPSAGDAAAALCIIEACLREANTSEDRVLALEDGIGFSLKGTSINPIKFHPTVIESFFDDILARLVISTVVCSFFSSQCWRIE